MQLTVVMSSSPYFAKSMKDRAFVCVFVFGVHLAAWYEVFHVLPHYYPETTYTVAAHCTAAVFFYAGALSNLYWLATTRTDCNLTVLGGHESSDWGYCERCCLYKPPRSHHCKICDVCILTRDHHCWFSGCCIGHSNHRYYLSLLLYMFSAAAYANLFHWRFAADHLGHLGFALPVCLVAPHVGALLGFVTLYEFLLSVMTFLALFCAVMFAWLLEIQLAQLLRGQTRYERKVRAEDYDLGPRGNVVAIMGRRWYVAWISPLVSSPLPGNGIVFPTNSFKTK